MHTVVINSRGLVRPNRITVGDRDTVSIVFDFGLLFPEIDSYHIDSEAEVVSDSIDGRRITVTIANARAQRVCNLIVSATHGDQTLAATVQVRATDRRRWWGFWDYGFFGGGW